MLGDAAQNQADKELLAWLETIPFSKTTKNLTRDFSDAVLMAELLKLYYPRHVELHNYAPASSLHAKRENWSTLNRKVLSKLDMKLNKDTIHHLANASQGAIEKLLCELRTKILMEEENAHNSKLKCSPQEADVKTSKEKIGVDSVDRDDRPDVPEEIAKGADTPDESSELKLSKFTRLRRKLFVVFSWLVRFRFVWSVLGYCKLCRSRKRDALTAGVATEEQAVNVTEVTVPRAVYAELTQELREKEEAIRTLNHKIAYLESSMRLKDLRISSLTEQIPQNAVGDTDQTKPRASCESTYSKLRARSHNLCEAKTN